MAEVRRQSRRLSTTTQSDEDEYLGTNISTQTSSCQGTSRRIIRFDDILSERIGFGISQIITLAVVCQINFIGGCDQYFAMFVMPVLQTELNLSASQIEALGTLYAVGIFIGAILSGMLGDILGRRYALILGGLTQFVVTLFNAVMTVSYDRQVVLRFMYGVISGYILPIGVLIVTEIIPKHLRGRCLSLLSVAFLSGRFFFLGLCAIFMEDLSKGDWRAISLCQLFPMFTLILCSVFILDESPRFLVSQEKYEDAFRILDGIGSKNNGDRVFESLSESEKSSLVKQQVRTRRKQRSIGSVVVGLFEGSNLSITWRLILSNVLKFFIGSGLTFLMPFFMKENGEGYFAVFITTLGDIPAAIIIYLIIDMESVGRLRIINAILMLTCATYLFIFVTKATFFVAGMLVIRFTNYFLTVTSVSIMSESYATEDRSMGTGVSSAIGRAVSSVSPLLFYVIFLSDQWMSYLIFAGLSLVSFVVTYTFPVDLTNKPLDEHRKLPQKQQEKQAKQETFEDSDDVECGEKIYASSGDDEQDRFILHSSDENTSENDDLLLHQKMRQ